MSEAELSRHLRQLRQQVEEHNWRYYALDQPEISDSEYDRLMSELAEIERQHPELVTADSPTQRVGSPASGQFSKVRHSSAMLSLANAFSEGELAEWQRRVSGAVGGQVDYAVELKIDGLAISLTYERGRLVRGATRGDGRVGEDVSANLMTIKSIPLRLRHRDGLADQVEIRGEVYMPKRSFRELNLEMQREGRQPFANPRNAAAGSVRQLDPKVTASRNLMAFMYAMDPSDPASSQSELLDQLVSLGMRVNPTWRLCHGIGEVLEYYHHWQRRRDELDYEIDGTVVKVDCFAQ